MADKLALYGVIIVPAIYLVLFLAVRGRPRLQRLAAVFSVLSCIALIFAPAIMTMFWHIRHGNQVLFEGTYIRVPHRWVVSEVKAQGVDKGVELLRLPLLAFFSHVSSISFTPNGFPLRADPVETLKSWQSIYWSMSSGRQDVVSGPVRFDFGSQRVVCMKTMNISLPERSSASCVFPETGWTAHFFGERQDLDTFFEIVRNLTPVDVGRGK